MRKIAFVEQYGQPPIAFSRRRAAERFIENRLREKWREITDFERIGAGYVDRIQSLRDAYGDSHWQITDLRNQMEREMRTARALLDGGYRAWRADYEYNYGQLASIREVEMWRDLADWKAANAS